MVSILVVVLSTLVVNFEPGVQEPNPQPTSAPRAWEEKWGQYTRSSLDFAWAFGPTEFLKNPAVQSELRLTGEQLAKLKETDEKISQERFQNAEAIREQAIRRAILERAPDRDVDKVEAITHFFNTNPPPEIHDVKKIMRRKQLREVAEILDEDQQRRLLEIAMQAAGPLSVLWPEVQGRLGLKTSQKLKLGLIQERYEKFRLENASQTGRLFTTISLASRLTDEQKKQMRARFEALRRDSQKEQATTVREIAKILTRDQEKEFNELLGEPFTAIEELRESGTQTWKGGFILKSDEVPKR